MTYNLSAIMSEAWKRTRETMRAFSYAPHQLRDVFRVELVKAWRQAREAAKLTARSAESLRTEILTLENRSFLGHEGRSLLSRLKRALKAAEACEKATAMAEKRKLIASSQGRFCTVTFTKKDGTERIMRIQPARLRFHVKGGAATAAGRKRAMTRAARHPHLLPVWDAEKEAIRSVNLAAVTRIAARGVVHEYRT